MSTKRMAKSIPPPGRDLFKLFSSGVCYVCGCTDEYGCDCGCSWTDRSHTLCTACADLPPAEQAAKRREAMIMLRDALGCAHEIVHDLQRRLRILNSSKARS